MPEDDSKKEPDQKQASDNDPGQEESENPQSAKDQPDKKNAESQKEQPKAKDQQDPKKKRKLPIKLLLIGGVVLLILLFFGFRYWRYASTHEETDDAYTTGNTTKSVRALPERLNKC